MLTADGKYSEERKPNCERKCESELRGRQCRVYSSRKMGDIFWFGCLQVSWTTGWMNRNVRDDEVDDVDDAEDDNFGRRMDFLSKWT